MANRMPAQLREHFESKNENKDEPKGKEEKEMMKKEALRKAKKAKEMRKKNWSL